MTKRKVSTHRRRRSTSDGGRKRASAPQRKKPSSSSSSRPHPSSSSGSSSSGGSSGFGGFGGSSSSNGIPISFGGGKFNKWISIVVVLIFVCIFLYGQMNNDDGGSYDNGNYTNNDTTSSTLIATERPSTPDTANFSTQSDPFIPPPASTDGQTWLIMLYQDADDKILEKDIYLDLNEAEKIGSNDRVQIVAQVDRFDAGYQGDGDWSSTKRFYITQDDDLQHVHSQQIMDLGEANMADGETLVEFVTWAADTFPADKYVLIMSDHGMGWPGGWTDPSARGTDGNTPLSNLLGDQLYLDELDNALAKIRAQTDIEQFELIGMDACLMAHIEVFSALAPHSRYAVASQETEPALGWAYTGFLDGLSRNPDMTGADLGQLIVDTYIEEDQRIVDDAQRAAMLHRGSPLGGLFGMLSGGGGGTMSASQLAAQMEQNVTITAVDLAAMPNLMSSVNDLAVALQEEDQPTVAESRTYAQSFTSVFGSNVPASYIDLGSFVQLIRHESRSNAVTEAIDGVLASLGQTVIAEKHGSKKAGATGMSIYFPNSQLYSSPAAGAESYTGIARRFAQESLWDDYLAYHYNGRPIDPSTSTVVIPERGTAVTPPGSGQITLSPLTLSSSSIDIGETTTLAADISGENVGYVYLFVGFVDQAAGSIFLADMDYLDSDNLREVGGVYYPDWGDGDFTVTFDWEPVVFAIDDGVNTVVARFTPQTYGAAMEDTVYTVDGMYTYADGGEPRYARLYFSDGVLRQAFGFTGEGGTGSPREIHPQTGDSFTVLEQWMDLGSDGRVAQSVTQEGGTLTFGDDTFYWLDMDAAAGEYIVGFIVEDLDGNKSEVFEQVTVK